MNTFGRLLRVTAFGESHGPGIGCVVDGLPAGLGVDLEAVQRELNRRRPGQSPLTTQRQEADRVEALSGIYEGRTTGAPVCLFIKNEDARPADYAQIAEAYRPSHADYTYEAKYGLRDPRGGGRASARATAAWVAAAALVRPWLAAQGISVQAWVSQVGTVALPAGYQPGPEGLLFRESHPTRCPDPATAARMEALIAQVRDEGDTIGGICSARITGLPPGLGEPLHDKLHARLAQAMLTINAAKGFEYGAGFAAAAERGSQLNDVFITEADGRIGTRTNHSGGIQGGISNGQEIPFRVAFKPVATLLQAQQTVNRAGEAITLTPKGRHDPCVLPRAVPIVEAMALLVVADFRLLGKADTVQSL